MSAGTTLFWYLGVRISLSDSCFFPKTINIFSAVCLDVMSVRPAKLVNWTARGNGSSSILIMDANKIKSHLAASQQSSQRCFSTYLILLTIRGREGSARESYMAVACAVSPAHMITLSRMMSARNQTSAQWQMHTASTVSITNAIWQICPLSWLEDEEQMLLFLSQQAWEMAPAVLVAWKWTVSK